MRMPDFGGTWFAVGFHCWRKGHEWQTHRPTRCVSVTACAWCGKYRGASVVDRTTSAKACHWFRPGRILEAERLPKYPDLS